MIGTVALVAFVIAFFLWVNYDNPFNQLRFVRRWRSGEWVTVNGTIWGKRWIRVRKSKDYREILL